MSTDKQDIKDMIERMPDDISRKELLDRLYIKDRLELSKEDYRQNGGMSHEDVIKRTDKQIQALREKCL